MFAEWSSLKLDQPKVTLDLPAFSQRWTGCRRFNADAMSVSALRLPRQTDGFVRTAYAKFGKIPSGHVFVSKVHASQRFVGISGIDSRGNPCGSVQFESAYHLEMEKSRGCPPPQESAGKEWVAKICQLDVE